jgi:hypothetical protein
MPVISMFHGILVRIYFYDTDQHNLPHIHVECAEETAVYDIAEGQRLAGSLNRSKERLVLAWIELHREELAANWKLATQGQPLFRIDPLR